MAHVSPTVFVVDDDVSVRESLELLIQSAGWQPLLFASAQEFLDSPRHFTPSCLILDVHLPDLDGLALQGRIAGSSQELPVIFITGYGDVPMTVRAMKAGAIEFLTKPFDDVVLLDAIQAALDRSRNASSREEGLRALRDCAATLTPRERQVMDLVVLGRLNKQIGGDLGISEITVKAHRGKLMRKMKAPTLADLIKMAAALQASPGSPPSAQDSASAATAATKASGAS